MKKESKKTLILVIVSIILLFLVYYLFFVLKFIPLKEGTNTGEENKNTNESLIKKTDDISTTVNDNSEVIKVTPKTSIRVINKYDENLFKGKKSLIIMFGTWCHNCSEELDDLADIVNFYKNSDINVVLVAHEFEKQTLIDYIKNSDIVYNTEIYLDLNRIIRKSIDPEASTVPVSYLLDENVNVLNKIDTTINLQTAKSLVNEYLK